MNQDLQLNEFYVDLHIHIGRTLQGRPVKITGSKNLTVTNIIQSAANEKGLHMIGIIDSHVPEVQDEYMQLIKTGIVKELANGGLRYSDSMTIILGCEIEVMDEGYHPVHYLCYFPTLEHIGYFTNWISRYMKNITLSSQRIYRSTRQLQAKVKELDGLFVPAHIFTPFKGIYGSAVNKMEEICALELIDAVELGLSGNTDMADTIAELTSYTYLTNSDAHSLSKIAREYQKVVVLKADFLELQYALYRKYGRHICKNYGLSPQLGKYHLSVCTKCKAALHTYSANCPICNGKLIRGVKDRIEEIAAYDKPAHPNHRPPYIEQIPLEFLPGIGRKTYARLLDYFGTEMNILHRVPVQEIEHYFGRSFAQLISLGREGKLLQKAGGGGIYGSIVMEEGM